MPDAPTLDGSIVMLNLVRKRRGRRAFVVLMTTLLLVIAVAPPRTSVAAAQTRLLEQKLLQWWPSEDTEAVLKALEAAEASEAATVDEFVDVLLGQLDATDGETARAVLSQVLPGMPPDPYVTGGWLIDLRRLAQADRVQPVRVALRIASGEAAVQPCSVLCQAGLTGDRHLLGSNLTRGLIRSLISVRPLGP